LQSKGRAIGGIYTCWNSSYVELVVAMRSYGYMWWLCNPTILSLGFQLLGSRVIGTWLYRGLMPALLKYFAINSMKSIPLRNDILNRL